MISSMLAAMVFSRVRSSSDSLAEPKRFFARGMRSIEHANEIEICRTCFTDPEWRICHTACAPRPRLGSRRRRDRLVLSSLAGCRPPGLGRCSDTVWCPGLGDGSPYEPHAMLGSFDK